MQPNFPVLALIATFFVLTAEPVAAQTTTPKPRPHIYTALSLQDFSDALNLLGLANQLEAIDGQNVVANARLVVADGITWFVYGYNCQDSAQTCTELQFRAVFDLHAKIGLQPPDLNEWNRKSRFVRAYSTNNQEALVLEMDAYLGGGVTLSNLTDQALLWRQALAGFGQQMKNP
jgi:hypothetical protein